MHSSAVFGCSRVCLIIAFHIYHFPTHSQHLLLSPINQVSLLHLLLFQLDGTRQFSHSTGKQQPETNVVNLLLVYYHPSKQTNHPFFSFRAWHFYSTCHSQWASTFTHPSRQLDQSIKLLLLLLIHNHINGFPYSLRAIPTQTTHVPNQCSFHHWSCQKGPSIYILLFYFAEMFWRVKFRWFDCKHMTNNMQQHSHFNPNAAPSRTGYWWIGLHDPFKSTTCVRIHQ